MRAKELEIGSSAQFATSADPGTYTTLLAAMMRFMVPSPRFSLTLLPACPGFLLKVTFFAARRGRPTRKKSKGLRKKPKRCGVLGGQMAKVEHKRSCPETHGIKRAGTVRDPRLNTPGAVFF